MKKFQEKTHDKHPKTHSVPERIAHVQREGQPLDSKYRTILEPRLGHRFSDVRVHDDFEADTLANELDARAFTFGQDIFFRAGQFQPETTAGFRVLAHETVHTIQQDGASGDACSAAEQDSQLESEAHAIGDAVFGGIPATSQSVSRVAGPQIQCWPWDDDNNGGIFDSLSKGIGPAISGLGNPFGPAVSGLVDTASQYANPLMQGLESGISTYRKPIGLDIPDGGLSGGIPSLPSIPSLGSSPWLMNMGKRLDDEY